MENIEEITAEDILAQYQNVDSGIVQDTIEESEEE